MTREDAIDYLYDMRGILKEFYAEKLRLLPMSAREECNWKIEGFKQAIETLKGGA